MEVLCALETCGRRRQGLATARQLRAAGLARATIAAAVDAGVLVRVHRRVYASSPLPAWGQFVVTDDGPAASYVAHVRAALLSLGVGAAAQGRTAAALRGWPMLVEPARTINVAVPHGSRRSAVRGVKMAPRRGLAAESLTVLADTEPMLVTTAVQTLLDCSRTLPLVEAVVVCDSALRAGDVTLEQLQRAARALPGRREARRARKVLELCDPECGSVLESVLRVRMLSADIAGFATQSVIRDAGGRHVLRADFVFEAVRLIVEVDGEKWHQDVERDRRRDNQLVALGWRVLRYRWADVVHHSPFVLGEIRVAAGFETSNRQSASAEPAVAA